MTDDMKKIKDPVHHQGITAEEATEALKLLHKTSIYNAEKLSVSEEAGCFHCIRSIFPDEITEFVDDGKTGLCPNCGVDALLSSIDVDINTELLTLMHSLWFDTDY